VHHQINREWVQILIIQQPLLEVYFPIILWAYLLRITKKVPQTPSRLQKIWSKQDSQNLQVLILDKLIIFKECQNSSLMMTMMIKKNRKISILKRKKTKIMKKMNHKEVPLIYIMFLKVQALSFQDPYLEQQLLLNNNHRSWINLNHHLTKYKTYSRCKMIILHAKMRN